MVSDFTRLQQQMRRMMDDMLHQLSPRFLLDQRIWSPQMDILETPEAFMIVADVSGLIKSEIQVTVKKNLVYLSGRRERPLMANEPVVTFKWKSNTAPLNGSFSCRLWSMKSRSKPSTGTALLTVTLPKKPTQEKTIPIKSE